MHSIFARHPLIEPLEQRIAPALLVNGANLLGGSNPKTGQSSIGSNDITRVTVLTGEAIVWYDHGYIAAISVGPNTSLDIVGDVGTIVGNLTASGQLSNSAANASNGLNGDVLLPNNITGITTHPLSTELGSIGAIITGGSISNLNIAGDVGSFDTASPTYAGGIYAGDGVFHTGSQQLVSGHVVVPVGTLDVNPVAPGVQGTFSFTSGTAQVLSGASITNAKIGDAEQMQLFAGNGAAGSVASPGHAAKAGQAGGSVTKITIENAFIAQTLPATTPSYNIEAGAGGSGSAGGVGGSVSGISEISSTGVVDIVAGAGGTGQAGPGGKGGSISGLNMESVSSAYTVHAGKGGSGAPGGAGGSVTGVNFGGNQLSNGIVVAAPFVHGTALVNGVAPADDILLVDSLTGNMVIEQNNGSGTGFTPVVQDSTTNLTTIAPQGTTPVGAVVFYPNGSQLPDIAVAYKNSNNVGVYYNQGNGVFYVQDFNQGAYVGDTLEGASIPVSFSPSQIAAGNFTGDASEDLAVLATDGGISSLITLTGDGTGKFSVAGSPVGVAANPVSLITADIQGGAYSDLFAGFKSGQISALLSTGAASGAAFSVSPTGVTVSDGLLNLDYNPGEGLLMALNGNGSALTFYNSIANGTLVQTGAVALNQQPGTPLVAHFVPESQTVVEPVEVLSSAGAGSRIDVYTQSGATFALTNSIASSEALKNFIPVPEGNTTGIAAVGGSLEHFAFSQNGGSFFDVSLPFSGKKVNVFAGDGGNGVNSATNIAAGGAGGMISGMNILAGDITLVGGAGGAGVNAAGGAGGKIVDTPTLVTITGQTLATSIQADFVLTVGAGNGGSATGTSHGAIGGAGGAVDALNLTLLQGDTLVNAGDGGSGGGGAGGAGGEIMGLKSVNNGGDLDLVAGNGGSAAGTTGNGGAGGLIEKLTYSLSLSDQLQESPYNVNLTAGSGGSSANGTGGAGGAVESVTLTLQPANESADNSLASPATTHSDTDSTLRVTITAGSGGNGATGGAGGQVKSVTATAIYEQEIVIVGNTASTDTIIYEVNPVTAQLTAGNGGVGSKGAGGAGGAVSDLTMIGISHFDTDTADSQAGDTPLVIISGNGGNGSTFGGVGGQITNVLTENAQFIVGAGSGTTTNYNLSTTELSGAQFVSGHGGNGGAGAGGIGGAISKLNVAVEGFVQNDYTSNPDPHDLTPNDGTTIWIAGGNLTVTAGNGGVGGTSGKGGAGGSITNSFLGTSEVYGQFGLYVQGGRGGAGTNAGGAGGAVTGLQVDSPQNPIDFVDGGVDALSAVILAGNGGAGTGHAAPGGIGGSISQISQTKDINSAINLLQAGNGGAGTTTGGLGGSVSGVKTVGLIGQASDDAGNTFGVFNSDNLPQGIFAGAGGTGSTDGLDGSVTSINAYAIAAIGAAFDVNTSTFAAAEKVAGITANYIGFSASGASTYQGVSPGLATPTDGFIYSVTAPTGISGTVLAGSEFQS